MKKKNFESKRGSFQEIGAKWSKFSKFRAKIALLEALSCQEKEENGQKKVGKQHQKEGLTLLNRYV